MATNNATHEANMRRSQVASGIIAAQAEVVRQEEAIRELSAENEKLKKEIAAVTGVPYDYVKADKYATLKGEVDGLERRYQFEKMKKNELTRQYQLARIDLLQSRRLKGGINAEKENAEALQRQVDILENRLDQALTKFNDAISYNKELRGHIDIIREERRVFQRVYKRMEDDLRAKKKLMSERIEQSNKDLDERDGYLRQVEKLQKAIKEQKQDYDERIRELDASMVEIKDLREEQQRLQLELETRQYEMEIPEGMTITSTTNISGDLGGKRRQPMDDTGDLTQEDVGEVGEKEGATEEETDLSVVLKQLTEFSQDGDLVSLSKEYESLGEINFSLYKHVNELTTSREEMERDIRTLKSVIAAEHEGEEKHKRRIKELEERLAETEALLESLQLTTNQRREVLANIRTATEEVYRCVGCTSGDGKTHVNDDVHCTESNHLQILGQIEERVTVIISAYQRHQRNAAKRAELAEEETVKTLLTAKEISPETAANYTEDEDNALTHTANSQDEAADGSPTPAGREEESLTLLPGDEVPPFLPLVHMTEKTANAAQLVRHSCLPSAHLGGDEGAEALEEDGDRVVSHEEIRRQMERRLASRREREERAHRRRREMKEQFGGQSNVPRKRQ